VTERPTKVPGPVPDTEAHLGLVRQVRLMVRTIFGSPVGKSLIVLVAAIVGVVVATAYGQIRLNGWNRPFYDALSRRDLRDFLYHCRMHSRAQRRAAMDGGNLGAQAARGARL
jgi:hypothetical protein